MIQWVKPLNDLSNILLKPPVFLMIHSGTWWLSLNTSKPLGVVRGIVHKLSPHSFLTFIEETWEVFESAKRRHTEDLAEELGDVLYTVLFMILIAERSGWFDLRTVLTTTRQKIIRRHPHVFGSQIVTSPREAYRQWHASKQKEGKRRHSPSPRFRALLAALWEQLFSGQRNTGKNTRQRVSTDNVRISLLTDGPGHPVPGQGQGQSNRKAKH